MKILLAFLAISLIIVGCDSQGVETSGGIGNSPQIDAVKPGNGPVGGTITITGHNFSLAPSEDSLQFGDVKTIADSATTTQLTVKVPQGLSAGEVPISLLINGQKTMAPSTFNVTKGTREVNRTYYDISKFVMGADLSYTNQIWDHGGVYKDSTGKMESPYKIFSDRGANVIRLRLWKDPEFEKSLYDDSDKLYSNLADVTQSIRKAKAQGMGVNLDIHYSDTFADQGTQDVPEAWKNITSLEVLKDSVYQYTKQTLQSLNDKGLMPEFVQVGNETNCGMMYTNTTADFPKLNGCNGYWQNDGVIFNSAIKAVRDVSANSDVDTKIILHTAKPNSVEYFFGNIINKGDVHDFDIMGFSYYSAFSDTPLNEIGSDISQFRNDFGKDVMIVETDYPWTFDTADNYNNVIGQSALEDNYPATQEGQKNYMIALTQQVIDGGGNGVFYWEPDWITSNLKTQYGTGSSYENTAFFDFQGVAIPVFKFMTHAYEFPSQ